MHKTQINFFRGLLYCVQIILIFASPLYSQSIDESMQSAGNYYRNGEFNKAIEIYEKIRNDNYEGTSLYFNLANSYYRIGKLGFAIINYERALKLTP